ncbi:MAG: hypothetical protein RLY43_782 [Bacteroidota bacterium]|jgi:hypothetical protein
MSNLIESHTKPPIQIFLKSDSANVTTSKGDLIYYLSQPLDAGNGGIIYANLQQLQIPNSTYSIRTGVNNTLYVYIDDNTSATEFENVKTYTLSEGNYTVTELVTNLNTLMSGDNFTVTFDSNTLKLTFTHTTYDFLLMYGTYDLDLVDYTYNSNALELLGFEPETEYTSGTQTLTSSTMINLSGVASFYFTLQNVTTDNINMVNSTIGKNCNVLAKIPFSSKSISGGVEYYQNISGFKSRLNTHKIDSLHIKLYEDDLTTEFVPLKDWSAVIELTFVQDTNLHQNFIKA